MQASAANNTGFKDFSLNLVFWKYLVIKRNFIYLR